jgi:exopolysaccharide biosynthesis protein PssK
MHSIGLFDRLCNRLSDAAAPLIPRDRPAVLLGFPENSNCGDHAVWAGERALLTRLGIEIAYEASAQSYTRGACARALGNGTILMHGAANAGERHAAACHLLARAAADFPDNRIVVFPQQVGARAEGAVVEIAALAARHRGLWLFARDAPTEALLKQRIGAAAEVLLAPDPSVLIGARPRAAEPLYEVLWLARTDEARNDATEPAARLSTQPAEKFVLPRFDDGIEINFAMKQRPPTVLLTDWNSLFLENQEARIAMSALRFDEQAAVYLRRGLHLLSLGRIVVTDRLHAHIFALLMEIPHVLVEDAWGSNRAFYDTWTRDDPLVRMAASPAEAWALARSAAGLLKSGERAASGFTWRAIDG